MSNIEIILIVAVCLVPFLALIFVLPKFKKKVKPETKSYKEFKEEEGKEQTPQTPTVVETKPKEVKPVAQTSDFTSEDYRDFLKNRSENTTLPQKHASDYAQQTMPYIPPKRTSRIEKPKPAKTVVEEINDLSPELKALIIAGVLDKKDY